MRPAMAAADRCDKANIEVVAVSSPLCDSSDDCDAMKRPSQCV